MAENVPSPPLADPAPKTPPSPKVVVGALSALLLPLALAAAISLLTFITGDGQWILAGLPSFVQTLILLAASALSSAIAGYLKRDPIRETGARYASGEIV